MILLFVFFSKGAIISNMVIRKTYNDPLAAALNYCLWQTKTKQQELAIAVGYKNRNMISAILAELSPGSEPKRRAIASFFGYTYEDFLQLGLDIIKKNKIDMDREYLLEAMNARADAIIYQQEKATSTLPPKTNISEIADTARLRHQIVIEGFEDKERAIRLNEKLVQLEKRDPDKLKSLEDMLNGWLAIAPPEAPKKTGTTNNQES